MTAASESGASYISGCSASLSRVLTILFTMQKEKTLIYVLTKLRLDGSKTSVCAYQELEDAERRKELLTYESEESIFEINGINLYLAPSPGERFTRDAPAAARGVKDADASQNPQVEKQPPAAPLDGKILPYSALPKAMPHLLQRLVDEHHDLVAMAVLPGGYASLKRNYEIAFAPIQRF
jgi:hypothetical protein